MSASLSALALLTGALLGTAGEAHAGRADAAGYLRVGTRPDFQGSGGALGYWNLYGRLLNEGPYAALEFRYQLLERQSLSTDPWTSAHIRIEGGNVSRASADGSLGGFLVSQLYVKAGNVLIPNVTWQVGTLDRYLGDLGLYDMRPAQIFFETVGGSARFENDRFDVILGFGDSGFFLKPGAYNTIFTPGALARVRIIDGVEVGLGGQYRYEPAVEGNRFAPHTTPGLTLENWVRGEVVQTWFENNPQRRGVDFPDPEPTDAKSWKAVGYLGFGGWGPLVWNNFFASYERKHPELFTTEDYNGETYTLYVTELTDERDVLLLGDEIQLRVIPGRFDIVWAGLYGRHWDGDNDFVPSDHARKYMSTVLRGQVYITDTVHWLTETSIAKEFSENGNMYREHADSIFQNTAGQPDTRGLEMGDTDTRYTWQGKAGVILNPLGRGIYTRPSLRFLYGLQYSNQNNAFGNSFVETIDQYNEFGNVERHWHQVLAIETEVWF